MKKLLTIVLTVGMIVSFSTVSSGADSLSKCGNPPRTCAILV
ncbi:MAG TPA: hypothetical protein VK077_07345 [Virgibacillus sp.]|nr:hypothetical protein [Virgibacillus sp.]